MIRTRNDKIAPILKEIEIFLDELIKCNVNFVQISIKLRLENGNFRLPIKKTVDIF